MKLLPLNTPDLIHTASRWLTAKDDSQWLNCSGATRNLSPEWLKIVTQRNDQVMRVFTEDSGERPVGLVGLANINRTFWTGTLWVLLGDKSFARHGYATLAAHQILTAGFGEFALRAINTWVVEGNPSIRIAERLNFKCIGRQRQCHFIDGQPRDRIWFDLLSTEHRPLVSVGGRSHAIGNPRHTSQQAGH